MTQESLPPLSPHPSSKEEPAKAQQQSSEPTIAQESLPPLTQLQSQFSAAGGVDEPTYGVKLAKTLKDGSSEIFCLRYSPDGRWLIACCGDGIVRCFNAVTNDLVRCLTTQHKPAAKPTGEDGAAEANGEQTTTDAHQPATFVVMPCTTGAFRPDVGLSQERNHLAVGISAGRVQEWSIPEGEKLTEISIGTSVEVLSVAYAHDAATFAVGTNDGVIRIYDEQTKELIKNLHPGVGFGTNVTDGHSSRVFGLRFHPTDSNLLVSAGWDSCVYVWDILKEQTIMNIFGPHVCGDALDITEHRILTGSWRNSDRLQLWNLESGAAAGELSWGAKHWKESTGGSAGACRLYAACFSHGKGADGKFIAAGGAGGPGGINEAKVYLHGGADKGESCSVIANLQNCTSGVMALAFNPKASRLAMGLGNGKVRKGSGPRVPEAGGLAEPSGSASGAVFS
ncbi:unnamed protein product [Chrysoparadoxa australica]